MGGYAGNMSLNWGKEEEVEGRRKKEEVAKVSKLLQTGDRLNVFKPGHCLLEISRDNSLV